MESPEKSIGQETELSKRLAGKYETALLREQSSMKRDLQDWQHRPAELAEVRSRIESMIQELQKMLE